MAIQARHLLAGILAAALALLPAPALAQQVKAWAAPVDGAWTDPARWSPPGVPTALDFVEITAAGNYTVALQGAGSAAFLAIGGAGGNPILAVQGASAKGNASLRVSAGINNAGTLRLESSEGVYAANLTVAGGALVNRGSIEVYAGSGGQRLFAGDLRNLGRFVVDAPLQFSRSGGVYLNAGQFIVEAGRTLNISGASQVFRQQGGDLKIRGELSLASMAFDFGGGTIPEKPPLLLNTALDMGPAATGVASFRLRGRCAFAGDLAPGQTLWVNGTSGVSATLSAATGFTNGGTIRIESSEVSVASNLVVSSGALVNQGLIAINRGTGGGRILTGDLDNQGRLELGASASLIKSAGGVYTNTGAVSVPAGDTLTISNGTLTSHAPASIGGGGTLALTRLAVYASGTFGADLIASQCDFFPGNPTGTLRIEGYCRLNSLCSLNAEIAGTSPDTEYDRLAVDGQAVLGGTLKVTMLRGFRPLPCDQFTVVTHGSATGRFTTTTGLDLGDGLNLLPGQVGGLTLLARLSWQRISLNPTALDAAEGGQARSYRVCLAEQPSATVRITSSADPQLSPAAQELFFAAAGWQEVHQLQVSAVDDSAAEGAHTGVVTHLALSNDPDFQEYPVASVAVQIADNDLGPGQLPALNLADAQAREGENGELVFTARLSRASSAPVTVNFATAEGSARGGSDFTPQSGTLTFAPGETSKTLAVPVADDQTREPAENLFLHLSRAVNAELSDDQAVGTIADNDPLPAVRIADTNSTEGSGLLTFTLTLTNPSSEVVSVDYLTQDGTALAGHDYTPQSGTLRFAAGQQVQSLNVPLRGDDQYEEDEDFHLVLSHPVNAALSDSQARGGVLNDDALPLLSVGDATVDEGNNSTPQTAMTFEVRLSHPSSQAVSVYYTTAGGTALPVRDYTTASGTLLFSPGETSKTFAVNIVGDQLSEPDETFAVVLGNATNADQGSTRAVGTIRSDDGLPTLNLAADLAAAEGDVGNSTFAFTVQLSAPSNQTVTVLYATIDNSAKAGSDYVAANGTLTFAPGQTSKQINVIVRGDLAFEGDEAFALNLSSPTNATLGDGLALGTIRNDDLAPTIAVNDTTITEGNSGTRQLVFRVRLSNPTSLPVGVSYTTADSSALAGSDYTLASGRLQFNPLETIKTLSVTIRGDAVHEGEEALLLLLSDPVNATLPAGRGRGIILDDDALPVLSAADTATAEGTGRAGRLDFALTLLAASSQPITVSYTTADSTARAGSDYTRTSGTLTFVPGETRKLLGVTLAADSTYEADEALLLLLSDPVNATLGRDHALALLRNDDPLPLASVADTAAAEGDLGDRALEFAVSLSNPSSQPITVSYTTADSSARAGSDYTRTSGTLTFAPGQTRGTIEVRALGDTLYEPDEVLLLLLSGPVNAGLGRDRALALLRNDDAPAYLYAADAAIDEGDQGLRHLAFAVTLSAPLAEQVTVSYATFDGSARANSDYTPASGILVFAPGQLLQTVEVAVLGDTLYEPDETFDLLLSEPTNAGLGQARATALLRNDDRPPTLHLAPAAASEGNRGVKALAFAATLSAPQGQTVSATFATRDGSARADSDYLPNKGRLVFLPGETRKTLNVVLLGDLVHEPDETLFVALRDPINIFLADTLVAGLVHNDDPLPAIAVADTAVAEGHSGLRPLSFTLSLSSASGQPVTVSYAILNGTALARSDYLAGRGKVVFAPGQTRKTIDISVRGDRLREPDETLVLVLSNPLNGTLGRARATGTILDDDGLAKAAAGLADSLGVAAFPNPANPTTTLAYLLAEESAVRLVICNMLGQQLRLLVDGRQPAGAYRVEWDGRDDQGRGVGTGIYFYRLEAGPRVLSGKVLLVR